MTRRFLFFGILLLVLFFTGCNKNQTYEFVSDRDFMSLGFGNNGDNYKWFYFSAQNFEQIAKPELAPVITKGPWTEALRISSANNVDNIVTAKGYAIVNRLGILTFEGDNITLSKDIGVFDNRTAGNLMFVNDTPIFSVFKSSFFNDTISSAEYKKSDSNHLFLLQYDDNTQLSYPVVNCKNLTDKKESEVTDFYWNGTDWNCCIKYIEDSKVNFSYVNWRPVSSLLSITPASAKEDIIVTETDVQKYRDGNGLKKFSSAPDRVLSLLKGYGSKIPFTMELKTAGGASSRYYQNEDNDYVAMERKCKAILSKDLVSVLFDDGTFYIQGSLSKQPFFNNGNAIVLRLPKLPAGFSYGDYVITENTLFAAWEESSFFECERSGFIAVDLKSILYDK